MSIRLEMLQVARLAPKLLGDSSDLLREFLRAQQNPDGGFKDRAGKSDLYYTVFGIDALTALQAEVPFDRIECYLQPFENGPGLDFVHLCCLARCWSAMGQRARSSSLSSAEIPHGREILQRLEAFRSADGGYHPTATSEFGTAYGCFLALAAYQDLKADMPDPLRMVQCLKCLETADGAWANERNIKIGSTNATAAAVTLLRHLRVPVNETVTHWLLARSHPHGGFLAAPKAPLPDLLSTATALHALAGEQVSFEHIREPCLDFIDTLWTNEGGFHGHWSDDALDCEYTFYGLLALGHLSL